MTNALALPTAEGRLESYELGKPSSLPTIAAPPRSRVAYAAAHVVADPLANVSPWLEPAIDWDATLEYRRYLWRLGFSVAEAMDTAQRGMGLDWATSRELIARSLADARAESALDRIACGAGTDHLMSAATLDEVLEAYLEQCAFVEQHGGHIILMASRALAATARGPDDYALVYDRVLAQVKEPVIIHWLGDMFDPALAGYWGSADVDAAADTCLAVLHAHAGKVGGIKVSLLDDAREIALRARLPSGVRMYTGDDFNYPSLIASGSDALLGIFDAIAPAAAAALHALDEGDKLRYEEVLAPTVPLARKIFEEPTYNYKTGLAFVAWLAGHQDAFVMLRGAQSARSLPHLAEVFRLADYAGLLPDPDLAVRRMSILLAHYGVGQ